jgi:hypothetical protein
MTTPAVDLRSAVAEELKSFKAPPQKEVAPVPKIGDQVPVSEKLSLPHDKPTVIVFLRHCGDPCKSTYLNLASALHPRKLTQSVQSPKRPSAS